MRRGGRPPAAPASIAILATHWLGDTFWALQVLPFLRRRHPAARFAVCVRPELQWLAELWVPAAQVHPVSSLVSDRHREGWPRPWAIVREGQRAAARIGRPDLLIDLTNTPAAALFAGRLRPRFAIGAGSRAFVAGGFHSWRPMRGFTAHLATRPWWVLEPIYGADGAWPSLEEQGRPSLPVAAGEGRSVLLFPGAGWLQKRWPLDHFIELGMRLAAEGYRAELLFAPREAELAEEAARAHRAQGRSASRLAVSVTQGPQLLSALRGARAVVANDSGAAHLAAALGLPTIAIFGPTDPARCAPLGPRVRWLRDDCSDGRAWITVDAAREALGRLMGAPAGDASPAPGRPAGS